MIWKSKTIFQLNNHENYRVYNIISFPFFLWGELDSIIKPQIKLTKIHNLYMCSRRFVLIWMVYNPLDYIQMMINVRLTIQMRFFAFLKVWDSFIWSISKGKRGYISFSLLISNSWCLRLFVISSLWYCM